MQTFSSHYSLFLLLLLETLIQQCHCWSPVTTQSLPSRYLRWNSPDRSRTWDMQTAVTTFRRGNITVELHGMLHFGSSTYFDYYNSRTFNRQNDKVLFELLVDEELFEDEGESYLLPTREGLSPVQASLQDRETAKAYGWTCQVDAVHYAQSRDWIHADLTRQEFLDRGNRGSPLLLNSQLTNAPAVQAVTALLVGPPLLQDAPMQDRRLFSTLSIPGSNTWASTMAYMLRVILWLTVPCPELSVLLVDWSTLMLDSQNPGVSPLTTPVVQALISGQWVAVRQLLFGQLVLSRQTAAQSDDLLIRQRNDRALEVLEKEADTHQRIALLYGCSHCLDLQRKLLSSGFEVTGTSWRTAWSIPLFISAPRQKQSETNNTAAWALALPLYLGLGGVDWIVTWQSMAADLGDSVGVASIAGLYLVRHVFLYVWMSQFVLDWNEDAVRLS